MTHKEYLEVLKRFAVTTGDDAEDQRLADESWEEDYLTWLHEDFEERGGEIAKAMVMTEVEQPHHRSYTRTRMGKLQSIPQKGAVLKERGTLTQKIEGSKKAVKEFDGLLHDYFNLQGSIKELKNQVESKEGELDASMNQIRPLLSKLDNLEKEENKFKTEFESGDWKYRFIQYPRSATQYKDLYIKAFNMLNEAQKGEMKKAEDVLQKITSQEKFSRESLSKADKSNELVSSLTKLVELKEKGLRVLKKFFSKKGESNGKG